VLNFALKKVLGNSVDQKGSLVDAEKLRFDFSHNKPMTADEIEAVETICRDLIRQGATVYKQSVPLQVARSISAVRAVFGETYPDPVTVVSIGISVADLIANPSSVDWHGFSIEFCGGTHLTNTSEAKDFVILSEVGIAKGVRRIIAWTHDSAKKAITTSEQFKKRLNDAAASNDLAKEIALLTADLESLPLPSTHKPSYWITWMQPMHLCSSDKKVCVLKAMAMIPNLQ
jgi:alanyl-tRNA synthetase